MNLRLVLVNTSIRILLKLLARVRASGIDRVPDHGPLIIAVNHINFLESPLIYMLLRPRRVIGLAKVETWDNPALRVLANLWETIPIDRAAADTAAFRRVQTELRKGSIVVVAPEGTRSRDGRLGKGKAGIVTLAARAGVPILPIAHFGGEQVWRSLRRFRRTIVTVRVGKPIQIRALAKGEVLRKSERDAYLSMVMTSLAAMLPSEYRGAWSKTGGSSDCKD